MRYDYDVMVIGAGPAGTTAAAAAAAAGARVLLVERKARVGVPVRCAEYIPAMLLGDIQLPAAVIVQRVRGMRTWLPDGTVHDMAAPGCMIDRAHFDQALARHARTAGVEIRLACRAVARRAPHCVTLQPIDGRPENITTGVIIGADGPHSRVGRWMDAVNTGLLAGIQVRVPLVRPLEQTEVFFQREFFGGYGWLFPKGSHANVGLGVKPNPAAPFNLRELLARLVARLAAENRIRSQPQGYGAGWIPAGPVRTTVQANMLLAGDAAGQTHPITGAGVFAAVVCGRLAGQWAARAAHAHDDSILSNYEVQWQELWGDTLTRAVQRRHHLESHWNELDTIIRSCWVAFREYYADPA